MVHQSGMALELLPAQTVWSLAVDNIGDAVLNLQEI